ncbi:phosphatidate cytidylyltransferase [Chachezhania antarctica]|uniref:phosphatidate cytidylyltransferase n=1 Tax=Chachezhania antarctica TaxID=2340860 RepID=UPI000EAF5754|nr:phosphatidate cytidylyltransferase [Chachezhania antarctica]|tara:strand:- start:7263 stop:8087 length:825 start_codon:yes stop_codon:yes gene_type:complete
MDTGRSDSATGAKPKRTWADLRVRIISGAVLATAGIGALSIGGLIWLVFVSAIAGLLTWELYTLLDRESPVLAWQMGILAGACALFSIMFRAEMVVPTLLVPLVATWLTLPHARRMAMPAMVLILLAAFGMMSVRNEFGVHWMLWLVLVVAGTDIAGYFAGKSIGGPKTWPSLSPNKTWAGTIAGWVAAALIGACFAIGVSMGFWLVALSVAASMASQLADIAESAIKRSVGAKDSSALIPGHGGFLDRFDGMIGASVLVLLVMTATGYPAVTP